MCDLVCDVIAFVFEAAIRVKSMHLIKSRLKTKKRDNMEVKLIFHKFPSKRLFRQRIHSLLRRADARGCDDIILPYLTHVSRPIASLRVIMARK